MISIFSPFQTSPLVNGDDKENSCQKVTSNSSPQEAIKEDESPKAFPSWTDDKLHESGIASFPDIDSEIRYVTLFSIKITVTESNIKLFMKKYALH